ncbi:MAG: hypothetical protein QXP31_11375 [Pyrobaculum sp.]
MLTALAVLLAILVLVVEPLGIPYYATTAVDVKSFEIAAGGASEQFLQIPWPLALLFTAILVAVTAYIEYVEKIRTSRLSKTLALLALLYSAPLPYIYIVGNGDVVIVISNFAKYLSIPIFYAALLSTLTERMLAPKNRARIIADFEVTWAKTEKA